MWTFQLPDQTPALWTVFFTWNHESHWDCVKEETGKMLWSGKSTIQRTDTYVGQEYWNECANRSQASIATERGEGKIDGLVPWQHLHVLRWEWFLLCFLLSSMCGAQRQVTLRPNKPEGWELNNSQFFIKAQISLPWLYVLWAINTPDGIHPLLVILRFLT